MAIAQTTPPEAYAILTRQPDAVYLDVRTVEEFAAGHPAGARNVPVFLVDPATGRPRQNPDFISTVQQRFPPGTRLLVGCQSGMRSQRACELLAAAGYDDLSNVQGSFGGTPEVPGWRDAGLPVETGPERS